VNSNRLDNDTRAEYDPAGSSFQDDAALEPQRHRDDQVCEPMMQKPLTTLERRILDYLVEYLRNNTYQPSIREIGQRFGIRSTKTVSEYLQSLADKGWIERDPSRSRGVRLIGLEMSPQTVTVPRYHNGAGRTDTAAESFELDRSIAGATGVFCIRMVGDALVRDGVLDGDLLIVEPVEADQLVEGDLIYLRAGAEPIVRRYAGREASDLAHGQLAGRVISMLRNIRSSIPATAPLATVPGAAH